MSIIDTFDAKSAEIFSARDVMQPNHNMPETLIVTFDDRFTSKLSEMVTPEVVCVLSAAYWIPVYSFEYNGRKFMAFVNILDKFHPSVQVIEGDYTTLEGLKAALDAYSQETVFFSAPIQDPMDATVDGHADVVIGDCCVRKIGNDIYMAAGTNVAGISVFKFNPGFLVE